MCYATTLPKSTFDLKVGRVIPWVFDYCCLGQVKEERVGLKTGGGKLKEYMWSGRVTSR